VSQGYGCYNLSVMEKTLASRRAQSTKSGKDKQNDQLAAVASSQRNIFLALALNMSWQLAIVVLVPILAGVKLDKVFGTHDTLTFVGLGLAVLGSGVVMWRAMQRANRMPVPKLTDAQKRAIKKAYEEEDKDE
jgi:hypothetical protein